MAYEIILIESCLVESPTYPKQHGVFLMAHFYLWEVFPSKHDKPIEKLTFSQFNYTPVNPSMHQ